MNLALISVLRLKLKIKLYIYLIVLIKKSFFKPQRGNQKHYDGQCKDRKDKMNKMTKQWSVKHITEN